jgi:putative hydrolase of the HAD superfamily
VSPVDAVIFDWGGTLTPWHTVDLRDQWSAYTRVYDRDRADELAGLLLTAETEAWQAAREHQRSGTMDELLRGVGIERPARSMRPRSLPTRSSGFPTH